MPHESKSFLALCIKKKSKVSEFNLMYLVRKPEFTNSTTVLADRLLKPDFTYSSQYLFPRPKTTSTVNIYETLQQNLLGNGCLNASVCFLRYWGNPNGLHIYTNNVTRHGKAEDHTEHKLLEGSWSSLAK